jgi:hypothetical protein
MIDRRTIVAQVCNCRVLAKVLLVALGDQSDRMRRVTLGRPQNQHVANLGGNAGSTHRYALVLAPFFPRVLCLAVSYAKGSKGQRRPADVVANAVTVMKIATGEIEGSGQTEDGKSKAAVELGRKGGLARAKRMKKADRIRIARNAAKSRWNTKR